MTDPHAYNNFKSLHDSFLIIVYYREWTYLLNMRNLNIHTDFSPNQWIIQYNLFISNLLNMKENSIFVQFLNNFFCTNMNDQWSNVKKNIYIWISYINHHNCNIYQQWPMYFLYGKNNHVVRISDIILISPYNRFFVDIFRYQHC